MCTKVRIAPFQSSLSHTEVNEYFLFSSLTGQVIDRLLITLNAQRPLFLSPVDMQIIYLISVGDRKISRTQY